MKFSQETIEVLKNFSEINQGLVFNEGNILKTMSVAGNVLASVKIKEDVPQRFAIYDLNDFLATLSLFKEPVVEFIDDKHLLIKEESGKSKCRYFFANEDIILTDKQKERLSKNIKMPKCEINFELENNMLKQLKKASSVMKLPDFVVKSEQEKMMINIVDTKNDTSNTFDLVVGETEHDFSLHLKTENLSFLPLDYKVEMSSKGISHFSSVDNVEYWLALENSSVFN